MSVAANGSPARNRRAEGEARRASNVGEPAYPRPAMSVEPHVSRKSARLTPRRNGTVASVSGHAWITTPSPSRRRNGV